MAIPAGHLLTVGGLNVIDRLQASGLQNPQVPTEVVRETGNDLVVGKIATEADFSFQMTSWDASCDMMALLLGKKGTIEAGPSAGDANGTAYKWENCQFINLACPWASDTGSEGGHIASGVLIPAFYPTACAYKYGVTSNAEQSVTLNGGSYYMFEGYPIEEFAATAKAEAAGAFSVETSEAVGTYRVGGFGGSVPRWVFGVLVNGVIQQEGVDYEVTGGRSLAEVGEKKEGKKAKIKFIRALPNAAVIRYVYFSLAAHTLPQSVHAATSVTPAAVRGRNIQVWIGSGEGRTLLRGAQAFELNATTTGSVQREMGTQDPIGYNVTGTDAKGSVTLDPKEESALYTAIEEMTGISRSEVQGYINEHAIPVEAKIFDPKSPATVIKSLKVGDAKFQLPGTDAKVNQTVSLPISFESELGTFEEIKGE